MQYWSNDPKVKKFTEAGERYYSNTKSPKGEWVYDKGKLFREAVGEYVDHRVNAWWKARVNLTNYAEKGILNAEKLEKIRKQYDEDMADLVHGYGKSLPVIGNDSQTAKSLSQELKGFIDREILEGKIPDKFDDVKEFQRIIPESLRKK